MRTVFLSLLLLILCLPAAAQQWTTDYETARQTAADEGKSVVLVFSGSDWCAPCIKLDREIWQDPTFQAAAEADFVFYRADFPRKKENRLSEDLTEANGKLAERYNVRGAFPLVVVLTPEGDVLGQTGYQKVSPNEYLALLEGFVK